MSGPFSLPHLPAFKPLLARRHLVWACLLIPHPLLFHGRFLRQIIWPRAGL